MTFKSVLRTGTAAIALVAATGSADAGGYYLGIFGGLSSWGGDDYDIQFDDSRSAINIEKRVLGNLGFNKTTGGGYTVKAPNTLTATYDNKYFQYYTRAGATFYQRTASGAKSTMLTTTKNSTTSPKGTWGKYIGVSAARYISELATFSSARLSESIDNGWVIGAAIGWQFNNGLRAEFEVAYRNNSIDGASRGSFYRRSTFDYGYVRAIATDATTKFFHYHDYLDLPFQTQTIALSKSSSGRYTGVNKTTTQVNITADGDVTTWSFMANLWYDFRLGNSPITPFVGGGLGFAQAQLDYNVKVAVPSSITTAPILGTYTADDKDFAFAYQIGGGLGYTFENGMMLSAQYRYFATSDFRLGRQNQFTDNIESHNFLVGFNMPLGRRY